MTYFAAPGIIRYEKRVMTIELVEQFVCDYYEIPVKEVHKKCRKSEYVLCRQITILFSTEFTSMSTVQMGVYYNVHHATIVQHRKTIKDRISVDEKIRDDVRNIRRNIKEYRTIN